MKLRLSLFLNAGNTEPVILTVFEVQLVVVMLVIVLHQWNFLWLSKFRSTISLPHNKKKKYIKIKIKFSLPISHFDLSTFIKKWVKKRSLGDF